MSADKKFPMMAVESLTKCGGTEGLPPSLTLDHIAWLTQSPSRDAARKLTRHWPAELRVRGVGRRSLFKRDAVFSFLGLASGAESEGRS
jgi:hypothetical protein